MTRREVVAHWRINDDTVLTVHTYRRRWWLFGAWVLVSKQNYRGYSTVFFAYPEGWRCSAWWLHEQLQRIEYETEAIP